MEKSKYPTLMGEQMILPSFPINTQVWALGMMLEKELEKASQLVKTFELNIITRVLLVGSC